MPLRLLALTALLLSASALAAPSPPAPPTVGRASPDGSVAVQVTTDDDGRPSYSVLRHGKPVIAPSRLGFLFLDAPKFERNFRIAA
ncbi:MAG: glycoside hydrolase family 97 protein, partial [Lysobacteraceae bacterium]